MSSETIPFSGAEQRIGSGFSLQHSWRTTPPALRVKQVSSQVSEHPVGISKLLINIIYQPLGYSLHLFWGLWHLHKFFHSIPKSAILLGDSKVYVDHLSNIVIFYPGSNLHLSAASPCLPLTCKQPPTVQPLKFLNSPPASACKPKTKILGIR